MKKTCVSIYKKRKNKENKIKFLPLNLPVFADKHTAALYKYANLQYERNYSFTSSYLLFKSSKRIKYNKPLKGKINKSDASRYLWYKTFRFGFFSVFLLLSSDPIIAYGKCFQNAQIWHIVIEKRGAQWCGATTGEMSCGLDAARLGADLSHFNLIFRNHTH